MRADWLLSIGGEAIATDTLRHTPDQTLHALVLHGAGQSHRQRLRPLRDAMLERGMASAAIDFSGHGQSSAHHPNSLQKRLAEAQAALTQCTQGPRTVVGVSMSGEIAMRLACRPENRIDHLVTLVGAIYDEAAFTLPFGPAFSAALRRPQSWRDAASLALIRDYPGRITLIRAADDAVIPPEVADLIADNAVSARSCRIIDLPGVDHRVSERSAQDPALRDWLAELICAE